MIRVIAICALLAAAPAHAAPPRPATFALIIGVNHSVDADAAPLHYADDDAAQYFELFRSLGARTYLLTDLDIDDRKLYPQAAAESVRPTDRELADAVARLAGDLARARRAGVPTVLYVVYAGHGNVGPDGGYVALADARLSGPEIRRRIVEPAHADQTHLIVDACYSYLLAVERGPGGTRRALRGFSALDKVFDADHVGLLLSTSSARTSHEWAGFGAGVFSYEVRAGLQGAADADGDGIISYKEIAAFVTRANEAIANPAYRPDVYARPPAGDAMLLDLRAPPSERLGLDGGHYLIEDSRGIRLAELHSSANQHVELVRRRDVGALYVRDLDAATETVILPDETGPIAALPHTPIAIAERGPSDAVFGAVFRLPFDASVVAAFRYPVPADVDVIVTGTSWRRFVGWTALGTSAALGIGAAASAWSAHGIRDAIPRNASELVVAEANARVRLRNELALGFGIAGGVALVAGCALLYWPGEHGVVVVPTGSGAVAGWSHAF